MLVDLGFLDWPWWERFPLEVVPGGVVVIPVS